MPNDYLHDCLRLHGKLTKIQYGQSHNLDEIQKYMERVRSSRRLTFDDVRHIRDAKGWDRHEFGYFPPRGEIESLLASIQWDFWNLPKQEDSAIADLMGVFHQIELVSTILRFVMPREYGILSPPMENVLGLGPRENHEEKYKEYVGNLRAIRDARNFDTAADADMALWVLQVGVLDGALKNALGEDGNEYRALLQGYKEDWALREIRVGNLTRQLFDELERWELAEALLATDVHLAGQIASIEFECYVARLIKESPNDRSSLAELVDEMCRRYRKHEFIVGCKAAVGIRNRFVHQHPNNSLPNENEARRLINAMRAVKEQCDRVGA